ncbi:MAG: radical SAM protein [Christensenellaceae bacterium]|nr:radical SAM protein [Christensenellaceae bacterium]
MKCYDCPRMCGVDRENTFGYCGMPKAAVVARAALHFWEEPCISGKNGSGTIFFSGCSLRCIFCQNHEISQKHFGKKVSIAELADMMKMLEAEGAHNINLVTATHFAHLLPEAITKAKLHIPVVYNCGGYERLEVIQSLDGLIDIYLPDLKYFSPELSGKFSGAANYFEKAAAAILEMIRQTGKAEYDSDGIMQKGVIIRHLVLPGHREDSMRILDWIKDCVPEDVRISLMRQYTPRKEKLPYPELNRRLTSFEYDKVAEYAEKIGIKQIYFQEKGSAESSFTPDFDLTGVEK